MILEIPWTYVTYCSFDLDNAKQVNITPTCTIVADNIKMANGINISPDGKLLYVTATLDRSLLVYSILEDPAKSQNVSTHLSPLEKVQTDTLLDNIDVDLSTEDLYIGAHPQSLVFMRHASNPLQYIAPSQVQPTPQHTSPHLTSPTPPLFLFTLLGAEV